MEHVKYLVLGAGVSGLSFANMLCNQDYLIIEKEGEAGGYCRTTRLGEYVWDYAGHFFHFSQPELKKRFETIISSDDTVLLSKNTKIYYNGYYVDYPFQKNIHQLSKDEMIDCLYGLFEKTEKESYDSFLDMLYGKFGEGITEKFLRPYNEKLYACDLNLLDVEAMGRFFPYADVKEIIRNMKMTDNSSYNQSFIYPKQGAAVFIKKLLDGIHPQCIRFNESILQIDTKNKVVTTNKSQYTYDFLVSSIPLNKFVDMADLDNDISEEIFSYNQVLVFNLGFDRPFYDKSIHWIYVPSKDINFYRAGFYNNIIGTSKLSMYIEIGYPGHYKISKEEIEKQLNLTLDGLRKIGIIDNHVLVAYESIIMNPAYVHITDKSIETVNRIKNILADREAYLMGRYGDWKYCSIEDCMVDAMNIVTEISVK